MEADGFTLVSRRRSRKATKRALEATRRAYKEASKHSDNNLKADVMPGQEECRKEVQKVRTCMGKLCHTAFFKVQNYLLKTRYADLHDTVISQFYRRSLRAVFLSRRKVIRKSWILYCTASGALVVMST